MRHTITKEAMAEFLREHWVLMGGNSEEKKYLMTNCYGTYRVVLIPRHGSKLDLKCETTDLDEAIRVYNEL